MTATKSQLAGVRAVFFDAVGTLLFPDPPAADVYAAVGRRHGSQLGTEAIGQRFAVAWRREEAADGAAGYRTSEARESQRWRRIVATVLDDTADPDACFHELYAHFRQPTAWRCDPAAESTLTRLIASGYKVGLASNNDQRLHTVLAGLPALAALGPRLVSSEIGWRKPAAAFFAALGHCTGLAPGQILYVGDDPICDGAGARAAGLHSLLVRRGTTGCSVGVESIEGLADLCNFLG